MTALASKDENGHVRVNPVWDQATAEKSFKLATYELPKEVDAYAHGVSVGNNHSEGIGGA